MNLSLHILLTYLMFGIFKAFSDEHKDAVLTHRLLFSFFVSKKGFLIKEHQLKEKDNTMIGDFCKNNAPYCIELLT